MPLRFTEQERERLMGAAARAGQSTREWMRNTLLAATEEREDHLLLAELTGQHMLLQWSLRLVLGTLGVLAGTFNAMLVEISQHKAQQAQRLRGDLPARPPG